MNRAPGGRWNVYQLFPPLSADHSRLSLQVEGSRANQPRATERFRNPYSRLQRVVNLARLQFSNRLRYQSLAQIAIRRKVGRPNAPNSRMSWQIYRICDHR